MKIVKLLDSNPTPEYKTNGSAAVDLYAAESVTVLPNKTMLVPLGVSMADVPKNVAGLLMARSSMHKKGLVLANGVGLIDSDYTDEIKAAVLNISDKPVYIESGERLVQLMFVNVLSIESGVNESDATRTGGFGSTG